MGLTPLSDNGVLIVRHYGRAVSRVTNGVVSAFAGTFSTQAIGDGGPASSAKFFTPIGIAVDAAGAGDAAAATGDRGAAAATGDRGHAAATGNWGHAAATGLNGIAAALGKNGTAKGALGNWLVLAQYDDDWNLIEVKTAKVDGETIKADTAYKLDAAGEFVEAA